MSVARKRSEPMSTQQMTQQLVVFALSNEEYALPIQQVQEIIRYSEPRAVASAEPWIRGVISLRGKIVPVFDLGLDQKIVIVETGSGTAGVFVDEVEEVLTVDADQLDEVPGAGMDAIDAIAKIDDRLVVLLTPDRLLAGVGEGAYA